MELLFMSKDIIVHPWYMSGKEQNIQLEAEQHKGANQSHHLGDLEVRESVT